MRRKKGFTLIEVVLVLAIAGLILAMVMIALPALQKAQRNTQRKNDLSLIVSQMEKWRSHNPGVSVSDNYSAYSSGAANNFCVFYNKYVPEDMVDPSTGEPYKIALWKTDKVVNCRTGQTYQRGTDSTANGQSNNSYWARMEVGDIQYDDVARCDGETFDDTVGRSAGLHAFAMRMYMEGGATTCIDNGMAPQKNNTGLNARPSDPIEALGFSSGYRFFSY
jgi:prepilin-type N-terminal cleavage/methylation domain-containing protein